MPFIDSLLFSSAVAAEAGTPSTGAAAKPLDAAWEALRAYDRGSSRGALMPIDEAAAAALRDPAARQSLEQRLCQALAAGLSTPAREYICRKLYLVGSPACVPALRDLLADRALSHLARQVLEAIPGPEASQALRESLGRVSGPLMAGVVNSLGVRRDAVSVPELAGLIADHDESVAAAAVAALGLIGTALAAEALIQFQPQATAPARLAWADACLACAGQLLAGGHKAAAEKIYRLLGSDPKAAGHLRLAVEKGLARISR
jgi:hypothetical protein